MNRKPPIHPGRESIVATAASVPVAPAPARVQPPLRLQILQCGLLGCMALASYLLITRFLVQTVEVVGPSMSPTLKNSSRYFLNRLVFRVREPHLNEIVVFRDPADQRFSVKRIVAREGDTVWVKGGRVYVNRQPLAEPYLRPGVETFAPVRGGERSWQCGKGEYFVLGDNRDNSSDSRDFGAIPRQNILGAIIR